MELLKKANNLNKLINSCERIFIMGHRNLDLDAIASSIAMYEYVKSFDKRPILVINDIKHEKGVKKVLDKIKGSYTIKRSSKIIDKINDKSLLIIVDTNKEYLLQDREIFNKFKNVAVIDHHDPSDASITKGLVIIDMDTSSTCEMLTDLLDQENIKVDDYIATLLLSGIVLDTNNYVIKTTQETFRTSYLLTTWGANPSYVQSLLKQDIKSYVARQKVITNVKQINNVAISSAKSNVLYRREDLAKIADTLLQFDKIEASFVVGKLEDGHIGISARSLGNINVGKILEAFNGGGDENEAGASLENSSVKDVERELKDIIKDL